MLAMKVHVYQICYQLWYIYMNRDSFFVKLLLNALAGFILINRYYLKYDVTKNVVFFRFSYRKCLIFNAQLVIFLLVSLDLAAPCEYCR